MSTKERPATQVVLGPSVLCYVNLTKPKAIEEGQEEKYSVCIMIDKSDKAQIKKVNTAIEAAKEVAKSKWGGKFPGNAKLPLRDGDEDREDDPNFAGKYFIQAYSKTKPEIVDLAKKAVPESEVYSGMIGRVSVNFYPYDVKGKGIAAGLNNVQKVKDGERLAGRTSAADDFDDDFEIEDNDDL